jgi:hypothetical protein
MVLDYLFEFTHSSCCKFFQIQKYAKVIQIHIQKHLKFIFKHLSQNSEKPAGDDGGAAPVYIVVGLVVVVCVDLVS